MMDDIYFNHMFGWGLGGGLMLIMMILFWAAIIFFFVWLIRELTGGRHPDNQARYQKSALDILRERYAKGEINKEEFEAKKKDLGG